MIFTAWPSKLNEPKKETLITKRKRRLESRLFLRAGLVCQKISNGFQSLFGLCAIRPTGLRHIGPATAALTAQGFNAGTNEIMKELIGRTL